LLVEIELLGETLWGPAYSYKKYEWLIESGQDATQKFDIDLS
jgi:hypothetical protein